MNSLVLELHVALGALGTCFEVSLQLFVRLLSSWVRMTVPLLNSLVGRFSVCTLPAVYLRLTEGRCYG